MKISTFGMLLLLMAVVIGGCATDPEGVNATATPATEAPAGTAVANAPARPPAAPAVTAVAPAAPATSTAARATAPATPAPPAAPRVIELAEGTQLEVVLLDSLSSATNKSGDQFTSTLAAPLVVNGTTVIQKGTRLQGRIVDAQNSGRVNGKATMRLVLTGVVQNEKVVPIVTKALVAEAEATTGRDAKVIGGGTGVGAAIGAIAGGGKGAATGAIIGAAAGTGAVLATKGKEVEFPVESKLKFSLERAVDMPAAVKNPT